ncbi:hypothetical protein FNV43_RR13288 [Rhamnella rubrinervis]|uniref:Ubiquitin fusion degradation protein UFD1 N-terminal subdomain 1 domain-containing protein n=1 Tax=Rhamnella rubrinervis TaxID=2594499 RepID=A0A8K0MEY7_9ROSA|nr:hypothetical protein FNV43_RR13288 [Rhamnella rubrinervis]
MEIDQASLENSDQSWERSDINQLEANDSDQFQTHYHEYHSSSFQQPLFCYPISDSIRNYSHLENGDKIILPESALDCLSRMVIQYPMSFELRNPRTQKLTHCGVMEFSSEEGHVLLPDWMMEKMGFEAGELAMIKNVNLPEKPAAKEIEKEVAAAEEETKFRAFTGVGRRLDGTSVFSPIPTLNENSSSTSTCLGKRKLVFGSSESADQHKSSKALKKLEEEPNKGKIKVFQAFTGISYRLTD